MDVRYREGLARPRRRSLAYFEFMDCRSFRTPTSNSSEVEGGVLKHHVAGPKPNHSFAKSADATTEVSDMQITLKDQRAAKAMYTVPPDLDPNLLSLYDIVTQYCGDKVAANWYDRIKFDSIQGITTQVPRLAGFDPDVEVRTFRYHRVSEMHATKIREDSYCRSL